MRDTQKTSKIQGVLDPGGDFSTNYTLKLIHLPEKNHGAVLVREIGSKLVYFQAKAQNSVPEPGLRLGPQCGASSTT